MIPIFVFLLNLHSWALTPPLHYFENSVQADIPESQAPFLLRVAGCSAFFVANDSDRILVATARHCFGYDEMKWCYQQQQSLITQEGRLEGRCAAVVAATTKSDFFIFEADFGANNEAVKKLGRLELAVVVSDYLTQPLEMFGYPNDIRNGRPTFTNHCQNFKLNYDPDFSLFTWPIDEQEKNRNQELIMQRERLKHNCSTWAGNSGGPMIISGAQTAIGMPITYAPGIEKAFDKNHYGLLESVNALYFEKKSVFEKLKIKTVEF